MVYAESAQ